MTKATPLHFERRVADDGLNRAEASAPGFHVDLALRAYSLDKRPVVLTASHAGGYGFTSLQLSAQQARAIATELMFLADLAEHPDNPNTAQ